MPTAYEQLKASEEENGVFITNLAQALIRAADMDVRDNTAWGCALASARDFAARVLSKHPNGVEENFK